MKPYELHRRAEREAAVIADWYQAEAGNGAEFLESLDATIKAICLDPSSHEHLGGGIRRRRMPGFPYDVIFRERATAVRILAVSHHHRRPKYWKRRR